MSDRAFKRGVVKSYYPTKQCGFIKPDDGSGDVIFGLSRAEGRKGPILPGQRVRFSEYETPKGRRAHVVVWDEEFCPTCGHKLKESGK